MTHSPTDPDQTTPPATPRSYYTRGQLRAADLVAGDVILADGKWRSVLDVWNDNNRDVALSHFGADTSARAIIDGHLTGLGQWVVIRYLIEKPNAAELSFKLTGWRRCDLVTVQVPDPTLPAPSRLLSIDNPDRTLELPPHRIRTLELPLPGHGSVTRHRRSGDDPMTSQDPQQAYDQASFSTPRTTTFHGQPDCPACGTGRLRLWHIGIAYDGGGSIDSYASKPPPAEPNFRYETTLAVCRHADTDEPGCGFTLPLTQVMLGPHLVDLHQRQNIADYVARQTTTRQEPS